MKICTKQPDSLKTEEISKRSIRFPVHPDGHAVANGYLARLGGLLPRRWRRQVVIQGDRFWLPG